MGHALDTFMKVTDRLQALFGPASQGDTKAPVVHKHDKYESASQVDLEHFVVETDTEGHRYGVRKEPD
ncbi:hypothetical protein [Arthrobacter cavernae]